MRGCTKAENADPFSPEIFHGLDIGTRHQPVVEGVLHAGNHHRIGSLQPGGGHEGARHLGKIDFTRHQGFDRRPCVNDFWVDAVLG